MGKFLQLLQPTVRRDYVRWMLGVDVADQQNGTYYHDIKTRIYHWRRVIDQKMRQALTNALVISRTWADGLLQELCVEQQRVKDAATERGILLEEDGTEQADGLLDVESDDIRQRHSGVSAVLPALRRYRKAERADWEQALAARLMERCQIGSEDKGGRRKRAREEAPRAMWGVLHARSQRRCFNPSCGSKSSKGCACHRHCTRGDEYGVLMCKGCHEDLESHAGAAQARWRLA